MLLFCGLCSCVLLREFPENSNFENSRVKEIHGAPNRDSDNMQNSLLCSRRKSLMRSLAQTSLMHSSLLTTKLSLVLSEISFNKLEGLLLEVTVVTAVLFQHSSKKLRVLICPNDWNCAKSSWSLVLWMVFCPTLSISLLYFVFFISLPNFVHYFSNHFLTVIHFNICPFVTTSPSTLIFKITIQNPKVTQKNLRIDKQA